ADRGGVVMGELREHQPVLGGALYPRSDVGDEGAGDPDPVIEPAQRPKDTGEKISHRRSGRSPPWKRPKCRAAKRAITSAPAPSAATSAAFRNPNAPTRQTSR